MKFRLPLRSDPGWTFWADWYERYVKGDPQPWDLLEKIALQGTEDDDYSFWEGTDAEVNARIMEIVAAHEVDKLIAENPYALKIIVDRKTEKLASTPSETVSLADIIKAIRRALRDYKRRCEKDDSANKLGEQILSILGSVVEDLERDIRRFKGDPLNLHEGIKAAAKELHKTAAREGLTNEGAVERLCDSLETALTDIAVASPDVLETLKARNKVQVQLFSDEQVKLATRLISGMEQDSEGLLKAAAHLALQVISDESKDIEEKQAAWYFVRAVVPRGAKAMKEHIEEKAKAKSLGDRAGEVADAVIKGDKVIGAGQEAVQEAGPWLTEAWTQIASGSFFGF